MRSDQVKQLVRLKTHIRKSRILSSEFTFPQGNWREMCNGQGIVITWLDKFGSSRNPQRAQPHRVYHLHLAATRSLIIGGKQWTSNQLMPLTHRNLSAAIRR